MRKFSITNNYDIPNGLGINFGNLQSSNLRLKYFRGTNTELGKGSLEYTVFLKMKDII